MFSALNQHGETISLWKMSFAEVTKLRNDTYFCPTCQEKVIVRAGPKVIPHFAHLPQSLCRERTAKGESNYHILAKSLLFDWLIKQNFDVTLEKYFPEIQQRPDLVIQWRKQQIAVEFQSATVGLQNIAERNQGFRTAKLHPIWILGFNQFAQTTPYSFRIKAFHELCFLPTTKNRPITLVFFCPMKQQFTILSDLIYVSSKRIFALKTVIPLPKATLPKLFSQIRFSNQLLYTLWQKEKYTFRMRRFHFSQREIHFRQLLYQKGFHLEQLPSVIYLPIRQQYKMNVPLWLWQSELVLNYVANIPVGGIITIQQCSNIIMRYVKHAYKQEVSSIVTEYLQQFIPLGILAHKNKNAWWKRKQLDYPCYIEEALKSDAQTLRLLQRDNKQYWIEA